MIRIIFKDEGIRQFRVIHISSGGVETEIDSALSVDIRDAETGCLNEATVKFIGAEVIQE